MQYLFLDESGELGFSQNSSSHFLLTMLQTDAPKQLKNAVRRQKKALHDAGWPRELEIKGTSLNGCHRINGIPHQIGEKRRDYISGFIRAIVRANVTIHYAIVNKSRITENLRQAPYGIAYNYYSGNLLCKIHNKSIHEPIKFIVDKRNKETHNNMPFTGYIQTKIISECNHTHGFDIKHEDSRDWLGLQAVDLICWSIFRHYEHKDSEFLNLIAPHIGVRDSWYA